MNLLRHFSRLLVAVLCLWGGPQLFSADEDTVIERHHYSHSSTVAGIPLTLVGVGDVDWGLWNVHTAGLYLPEGTPRDQPLNATAACLTLCYQRALTAANFREATEKTFGKGLTAASRAAFAPALAKWNALYQDRGVNQRYTIVMRPGRGAILLNEGGELGEAGDHAFAVALLAIWLGQPPLDKGLRRQLLGK